MDNLEKYGFCPYSDQVDLNECNPFVSVCSDCDTFFEGFEKGREYERKRIAQKLGIDETELDE